MLRRCIQKSAPIKDFSFCRDTKFACTLITISNTRTDGRPLHGVQIDFIFLFHLDLRSDKHGLQKGGQPQRVTRFSIMQAACGILRQMQVSSTKVNSCLTIGSLLNLSPSPNALCGSLKSLYLSRVPAAVSSIFVFTLQQCGPLYLAQNQNQG